MAAESVKKNQISKQRKPTELQQKIIDISKEHPSLNKVEIAAVAKCDHAHVVRTLQTYGIIKEECDNYVKNRADVLAGLQHRLIKSITDEDIKKAPLGSRVLAVAQLYDKERLERGQSTANVSYDARTISASVSELRAMIADAQGDTDG